MALFALRLARRVELKTPHERELEALTGMTIRPAILQKGERVEVLDIPDHRFLVQTRHGRALLGAEALKPCR